MTRSKALKYLSDKDPQSYSTSDRLLKMKADGHLEAMLSQYGFSKNEVFFLIKQKHCIAEISLSYHNIMASVSIFDNTMEYFIYSSEETVENIEKDSVTYNNCNINIFKDTLESIFSQMKEHPDLKNTSKIENHKKIYKIISNIFLSIPAIVIGALALYVIIFDESIQLSPCWVILIGASLVAWFVFDVKSKR